MPPVNNKREERRMNENKARGESEERKHNKREECQTEEWKRGMREREMREAQWEKRGSDLLATRCFSRFACHLAVKFARSVGDLAFLY